MQVAGENCMRQMLEALDGETYSFRYYYTIIIFFKVNAELWYIMIVLDNEK